MKEYPEMFMEVTMDQPVTDEIKNILLGGTKERPAMMGMPTAPVYEHEDSRYPERVRIKFFDGKVKTYDLRVEQPSPQIIEAVGIIRKWNGYAPRHGRAEE